MTEVLTAAQMRAIEQAAIDSGQVTGLELMERAGRGVVEAILEWRPDLATAPHRAVVLCGPGNNGGDGFVVARLLKERGWEVEVFLYGDETRLPPDAAENCRRWRAAGTLTPLDRDALAQCQANRLGSAFLVVDALFGTGLSRPLDRALEGLLGQAATTEGFAFAPRVAIDLPSGLCSDSGRHLGPHRATRAAEMLTVSFHALKLGHVLAEGADACGRVVVKGIGLQSAGIDHCLLLDGSDDCRRFVAEGTAKWAGHKYTHGHAVILSGRPGKGGAARLAARGALRIGAGLVTVACPPGALQENAARLDAIMLRSVADAAALAVLLEDERLNTLCLGPGLGVGERTRALVAVATGAEAGGVASHAPRGVVLDADALTSFEDDPEALFAMLHEGCVLTPHAGEFRRLFPDIHAKLTAPATKGPAYSKLDATREAAARAGCVVLFKGPDTVIADPTGRAAINSAHYERAAPWLATAGSGDVLAGFITGLLARGVEPMAAAETAAWLHVECARSFGPGLIAEDLPEELPKVFQSLGL